MQDDQWFGPAETAVLCRLLRGRRTLQPIRGYALETDHGWTAVTLEPNVESDKVDILWEYPARPKAVQVKSTKNEHGKTDIQGWATDLQNTNRGGASPSSRLRRTMTAIQT